MGVKRLINLLVAAMLLLATTAAQAGACYHYNINPEKNRPCTSQEKLRWEQIELKEKARFDEEKKRAVENRVGEILNSLIIYAVIAGVVAVILAFVLGLGIFDAAGWFLLLCIVPISLIDGGIIAINPERGFELFIRSEYFQFRSTEIFLMLSGGVLLMFIGYWFRSAHRDACLRSQQDRLFSVNEEAMEYSRHDLRISVNQEKLQVIVNGVEISLEEFRYSHEKIEKKVTYNTGGNQTVYGSGGAIGTVYIPGESGSYMKHLGNEVTLYKQGKQITKANFTSHEEAVASYEALLRVLTKIKSWRDKIEKANEVAKNKSKQDQVKRDALDSFNALCEQAGVSMDCFHKISWDMQGKLIQTLAVDRTGKAVAVYNNGAETWMGSLKGASAQIVGDKIELKVDDPAYREKHLTERRFSLLEKEPREVLVEWEDRINLLAKTAA